MAKLEQWRWKSQELKPISWHFYNTCEKFPDRDAQLFNPKLYYNDHNGRLTWSQMKNRVEAMACGLMSFGLEKGDMVGIMAASSPHWTQADMAICCSGGVSVTIFPTLSFKEAGYIMKDSGSKFLFVGDEKNLQMMLSHYAEMPALKKIIVLDLGYKSNDERVIGLKDFIAIGEEWKKNNYPEYIARKDSININDWYTIIYTSGTTGEGKGVVLSHFNGVSRMAGVDEFWERYGMAIDETDRTLCFLPLSHIFDRGSCQLAAILHGSTIAYADKPGTLLEDMQKYNPTWINCVPRLYEKIYIQFRQTMEESPLKKKIFDWALKVGTEALEYRKDEKGCYNMHPSFDLASRLPLGLRIKYKIADKLFAKIRALFGNRFRHSFSASAGIAPELLKFFYTIGLAVVEGYGSTESFNACILNPVTACKPGYVGINANGGQSRIAEDGELEISEAGVFSQYLNKPEVTKESFTEDGWFKTGDLVIQDDYGYYKIIDRKKAIICTAVGKNIAPAKLENLFSTSSYVEQIFFIGDERNYITALIVPNFNYFMTLFDKEGINYDKSQIVFDDSSGVAICTKVGEDFVSHPRLVELIQKEVDSANKQLESFELIKNFAILRERFTENNGMLTPSQKTKKRVILEKYADVIEKMYS
jgi:long-chain acyl-CoA synthetase